MKEKTKATHSVRSTDKDAMIDYEVAAAMTRWKFAVYYSFVSCYLHLLIWLVPTTIPLLSEENDHPRTLLQRVTTRIYKSFISVQLIIMYTRIVLNFAITCAIIYILWDVTLYRSYNQSDFVYYSEFYTAFQQSKITYWILIGAFVSLCLWLVACLYMSIYLRRRAIHNPDCDDVKIPVYLYTFCYLDPINFLLDIPGVNVPVAIYETWFVRIGAITCAIILYVFFSYETPIILCFGCYLDGIQYGKMRDGLCPSCPRLSSEDAFSQVCDHQNVECGESQVRWQNYFQYTRSLVYSILIICFCVYFFVNRPRRIEYFEIKRIQGARLLHQ